MVHGDNDAQQNLKRLLDEQKYDTGMVKAGERYTL